MWSSILILPHLCDVNNFIALSICQGSRHLNFMNVTIKAQNIKGRASWRTEDLNETSRESLYILYIHINVHNWNANRKGVTHYLYKQFRIDTGDVTVIFVLLPSIPNFRLAYTSVSFTVADIAIIPFVLLIPNGRVWCKLCGHISTQCHSTVLNVIISPASSISAVSSFEDTCIYRWLSANVQ